MKKKEYYKHILPHFQQPGQAYFVTWCLKDAIPRKALADYTRKMDQLKATIEMVKDKSDDRLALKELRLKYYLLRWKNIRAYNDLLIKTHHSSINLTTPPVSKIVFESLQFWNNRKIQNYAFCIMPNHIHWVFCTYEKDSNGQVTGARKTYSGFGGF